MSLRPASALPAVLLAALVSSSVEAKRPPVWPAELTYRVFEPRGLPIDAPVLILLHGYGDSGRGFERIAQRLRIPFRVVLPDGPLKMRGKSRSWYRIRSPHAPDDVVHSTKLLAKLLRRIPRLWPSAPKPIVSGFSQGGVMSYHVAATFPELIGAALPMAGYLIPETFRPPKATRDAPPMLVIHGRYDGVVRYERGEEAIARFRDRGWAVALYAHRGRHKIPTDVILKSRSWLLQQRERLGASTSKTRPRR